MPHPLQTRVEAVRRKAGRLVRLRGLCLFLLALVAVAAVFSAIDYLLRWQDAAARWILSLLALAVLGWVAWRFVWPSWRYRLGLVQTAQRIEAYFPQLGQRLSSAVDFLAQDQNDKTAGSIDLRRAVVAEAEAMSAPLDFRLAIDARYPQWAWMAALGVTLAAAFLVGIFDDGRTTSLALARLTMPWRSDLAWPRRHQLEFARRIEKLAAGDDLELELIDKTGRLPDVVKMQVRYPTPTGTRTENRQLRPLAERLVFRLDNVRQSLAYRASGGDDDTMPWTELSVIEPPKVQSLDIAITPPRYTGLPTEKAGRIGKAIAGSSLAIRGRVDKPIRSARLRSETAAGTTLPAVSIAANQLSFQVPADGATPWLMEKSGAYWVELADESGLPTGRDTRFELQVLADSPPAISWETPADQTFVTPRALVPIRCLVKDDLAIRRVELRYLRPGTSDAGEQVVVLYQGPDQAQPAGGMADGDSRTIDEHWDLTQLAGLQPGDVLAVRITAEDYKPQLATSVVRRLSIITDQELESRLGQRQTVVLGQLAEALRIERQAREQVGALQIRLEEAAQLAESDLNHLQSGQLNQRQVEKLMGNDPTGVEGQLAALIEELSANRVEGQAVAARMHDLLAKVRDLNRRPLVEISQRLTEAHKALRGQIDGEAASGAGDSLATAAARQDDVIAFLEGLLGTLTEWDSFSRLAREIGQIRSEQEQLAEETMTLKLAAIAAASPRADERTAARQLAQRELGLARRLDKIQSRMEEMLGRLQATDPLAAGTLADALDAARRLAIGGQMRDAASKLEQEQLGQSHQTQLVALDALKQLLDVLSSRRDVELARTIKSLRAAAGELAGMRARQQALQDELSGAASEQNPAERRRKLERLIKELEALTQQMQQLTRKLQRLTAPRAAEALARAAESDAAAGQAAGQGDADAAQQQARQAEPRLEEAHREIEQAIAQAEQELAQQQLAQMEQWIEGLLARQKNVIGDMQRLEDSRAKDGGELTAAQKATLRGTAAEQRLLADETEQLRLKMAEQSAFALALSGARQAMQRAAAQMERGRTDALAQEPAQAAATRLEQMLAALQPESGPPPEAPPPESPPQPPPPSGQKDPFSSLAALKLLQLLQGEINRRTQALEAIRVREGKLSDEQLLELDGLAAEQGRLAEMVLNLIRESVQRPEDNPELLPEANP